MGESGIVKVTFSQTPAGMAIWVMTVPSRPYSSSVKLTLTPGPTPRQPWLQTRTLKLRSGAHTPMASRS